MAPIEDIPAEVLAARQRLREKMGEGAQTGGKGSVRRKSKPIPKSNHTDDKKVAEFAKKAGLQDIPGIEEANIIFSNGDVTSFSQPKVRGLLQGNTLVIHGAVANTKVGNISPELRGGVAGGQQSYGGAQPEITPEMMMQIQQIMQANGLTEADLQDPSKQELVAKAFSAGLAGGAGGADTAYAQPAQAEEEDDDDMPTLSGKKTFEDVSADAD